MSEEWSEHGTERHEYQLIQELILIPFVAFESCLAFLPQCPQLVKMEKNLHVSHGWCKH